MSLGGKRHGWALFALGSIALITIISACATTTTTGTGGPAGPAGTTGTAPSGDTRTVATGAATDVPIVSAPDQPDVQHLKFQYGPIKIEPGQNNITISDLNVPKPKVDGYIVGIHPNLYRDDGSVPPVDIIHLHHGVWLKVDPSSFGGGGSGGRRRGSTTTEAPQAEAQATPAAYTIDEQAPGGDQGIAGTGDQNQSVASRFGEIFFASGEEKTQMLLPAGYGYPYKATDIWVINYMLHNLLSTPDSVSIVYDLDFIPADAPSAKNIKKARPIWNDVESGKIYPVFDALKGSGKDGIYTYPDDEPNAYGGGRNANEWTVDKDMVLLGTGGHLHPGGLHTDMFVTRTGAGATASAEAKEAVSGDKVHIFESDAVYYEPAGAVSWDVSMTTTPLDWRVSVKKGDVISINATYDVKNASWYESMGIMVLWAADAADATGVDPYQKRVDVKGVLTHGHLPENDNHGGHPDTKFVDMTKLPNGTTDGTVTIADFVYAPGDMSGLYPDVPTVKPGGSLKFVNTDAPTLPNGIWHTITACKAPCNKSTGVAYPLADADVQFDSGELGLSGGGIAGQAPTAGRIDWSIPTNLTSGTYTYFCRIHPSMRGAFRVDPNAP